MNGSLQIQHHCSAQAHMKLKTSQDNNKANDDPNNIRHDYISHAADKIHEFMYANFIYTMDQKTVPPLFLLNFLISYVSKWGTMLINLSPLNSDITSEEPGIKTTIFPEICYHTTL